MNFIEFLSKYSRQVIQIVFKIELTKLIENNLNENEKKQVRKLILFSLKFLSFFI